MDVSLSRALAGRADALVAFGKGLRPLLPLSFNRKRLLILSQRPLDPRAPLPHVSNKLE